MNKKETSQNKKVVKTEPEQKKKVVFKKKGIIASHHLETLLFFVDMSRIMKLGKINLLN